MDGLEKVLDEYHQRIADEEELRSRLSKDELDARLDEFLLPIGPVVGQLVHSMIEGLGSKAILEVGTSYGYSTLWLADAARKAGGRVVSLEKHAGKQDFARQALERAGLSEYVDFRLGDALELIPAVEETVDFALIDIWKSLYVPAFDGLYPRLRVDGVVVADNMISPAPKEAAKYIKHLQGIPDMESVMLPIREGILVSRRRPS